MNPEFPKTSKISEEETNFKCLWEKFKLFNIHSFKITNGNI